MSKRSKFKITGLKSCFSKLVSYRWSKPNMSRSSWKTDRQQFDIRKAFVTHFSANCSLKSEWIFKKKNAFKKAYFFSLLIRLYQLLSKCILKMQKKPRNRNDTLSFKCFFFHQSKTYVSL